MEKELIETKGLFYKIKSFFSKIFAKNKNTFINVKEEKSSSVEADFKEKIVIKKDEEKERLLQLQEKFRRGELQQNDLSEEDIQKLADLYDEQIKEIEGKIEEAKITLDKYTKEIEAKKKKATK